MRPGNLQIVVRELDLDYLGSMEKARIWHRKGAASTHFLNALQAVFPEGERFFIEAAREGAEQLKRRGVLDQRLEEDFDLFLRQEGRHSLQHSKWNAALVKVGYPGMAVYDRQMRDFRLWLGGHFATSVRLAMTAAAEHYTASLVHLLAFGDQTLLRNMRPPFQTLLLYHAMEEIEHKAVCYDLYRGISGSYVIRIAGLVFVTFDIWVNVYIRNRYLLRTDGLWSARYARELRRTYVGRRGILRVLWPRVRAYLRPSFHPWQSDERARFERACGDLREKLGIPGFLRSP